jgi:hypothetical protein
VTCACCHRELSEGEAYYRVKRGTDRPGRSEAWDYDRLLLGAHAEFYCPECFGLIVRSQPS